MDQSIRDKFAGLQNMIGRTPLLEVDFVYKGVRRRVYAKAEYYNYTGSIKDRIAYYILYKAYETGALEPGQAIAEASSGNTGISISALGSYLGNPVTIFMPDWMCRERCDLIASFGATLRLVTRAEGGFTGSIRLAREMGAEGAFLPEQFTNPYNTEAHKLSTGPEILEQLASWGLECDCFVGGVGTGGTLMGVGSVLKQVNPNCRVVAMDPESSPTLITHGREVGPHRIAGIGDEFVPDIIDYSQIDDMILVDDSDAINMARMFSTQLGLGVGISSGANFLAAVKMLEHRADDVVVTVFADDNKKYLSTDLMQPQELKPEFLSSHIQLLGLRSILA